MKRTAVVLYAFLLAVALAKTVAAGPLEDAKIAANSGDFPTALRLLRPLADQGNAEAQGYLGWVYENGYGVRQDFAEASRWYCKAADQGDDGAKSALGLMYVKSGGKDDDEEAVNHYCKPADKGDAARTLYTWTWASPDFSGNIPGDVSAAWYRKCNRLARESGVNAKLSVAVAPRILGRAGFDPAMEDRGFVQYLEVTARCIAAMPEKPRLSAREWYEKGLALWNNAQGIRQTDPSQAISYYSEALKLDPNYVEAYNGRGLAYDGLDQHQWAILDFDHALKLNPNFAAAYNNRGAAYGALGQHERAILDFDKAIQLNANLARPYWHRGNAHSALAHRAEAYSDWRNACQLGDQQSCDWLKKNPE